MNSEHSVSPKKPSAILGLMQGALLGFVVGSLALLAIYFISKILLV